MAQLLREHSFHGTEALVNLPALFAAARARFEAEPPHREARINGERVELWDHGGFDPWETLRWETVRVVRYRQHKPDGQVVEAYWLTDYPEQLADSVTIFRIAKSRWEIENQGLNEAKTYHGLEHITHHDAASLPSSWLILCLALTIERLYRCRFLRRGTHPPLTAVELLRQMRIQLGQGIGHDTS